jgi:hypothetical protein
VAAGRRAKALIEIKAGSFSEIGADLKATTRSRSGLLSNLLRMAIHCKRFRPRSVHQKNHDRTGNGDKHVGTSTCHEPIIAPVGVEKQIHRRLEMSEEIQSGLISRRTAFFLMGVALPAPGRFKDRGSNPWDGTPRRTA